MSARVAVFGDSAMWGQGLLAEHQFARLAVRGIVGAQKPIEVLPGAGSEPGRGFPRSGAKINAAVGDGPDAKILLPGGGLASSPPGDRAKFAQTFRSLFTDDQQMREFLAGPAGEAVAAALFGENPAAFPTVTGQVLLAGGPHPDVDFVVVNGGINDVDFTTVLDPKGPSPAEINQVINRAFGKALADLLTTVRKHFPRAVVIVPGYFAALSDSSDRDDLKELFEFASKRPEWQIAFNDVVQALPLLRDVFEAVGLSQDVSALVRSAIRRTVAAAAHAHHRTRATIEGLPPSVRLPGMFYAHPSFQPEDALFAGARSLVYSGYRFPGHGRLSVADEMLARRRNRIPRNALLGDYHDLAERAALLLSRRLLGNATASEESDLRSRLVVFRDAHPDLPSGLLRFLTAVANLPNERVQRLMELLGAEIGRIEVATIASFLHPNLAGAERYTERIVLAHRRYRTFSARREIGQMVPPGSPISLRTILGRRNTRLPRRLGALATVTHIESIALRIGGMPVVPPIGQGITRPALITLGPDVRIRATFPLGVGAGEADAVLFAFDTPGTVHLSRLTGLIIEDGPRIDEIVLHLNGREFAAWTRADATVRGDSIQFEF